MNNPLTAIPQVMPDVEARADARGCFQLRKPRLYTGGLFQWLTTRLRWRADSRIVLDEFGSFYWQQLDGQRTLEEIAPAFSRRYTRSLDESRRAVLQFTRDLMLRHVIHLSQTKG